MGSHIRVHLPTKKPTSGGSSDTDTNEPITIPCGPSEVAAVTMVTGVGDRLMMCRKLSSTLRGWAAE